MNEIAFTYERERMFPGFDGTLCKICPQIIRTEGDTAFLYYQMLLLTGIDVGKGSYVLKSVDGGKSFGEPQKLNAYEAVVDGVREVFAGSLMFYSRYHKRIVSIGAIQYFESDKYAKGWKDNQCIASFRYAFVDPQTGMYCSELMPFDFPFPTSGGIPFGQPIEYEDGSFLISFYYTPEGKRKDSVVTARCTLEGDTLRFLAFGEPLEDGSRARGLDEPSVALFNGKYYMTIRCDETGLYATSDDGLHFDTPREWCFEDGTPIGNYNTQQRWVRYKGGLHLVYTRRGAHNDHVFRHRAPLFMARFDEARGCLIRDSEVILVPEMGARLGNFTVTDVSAQEFWVVTAEWMQNYKGKDWRFCKQFGSDNAIWRAKVRFEEEGEA